MRKPMFFVLITILFSGLVAATASAQMMACWELEHGLAGIEPIVYKLSALDMGNGNYALVGSSYTTTVTEPPHTIRRVVTGGAVVMEADKIEVSLTTTDISDRASTTEVEGLAVSDVHMLLDGTLNGAYRAVNVHFPLSLNPDSMVLTGSLDGNVTLVDCN